MAEKGSLSERYCLLLEELRLEAIHQTSSARRPTPNADASCTTDANAPLAHSRVDYAAMQGFQADLEENLALPTTTDMNALFSDVTPDYGEWDQFASILASGLGNLEGLICEDFAGQFNEYAPS